jgi:hypothetical protein
MTDIYDFEEDSKFGYDDPLPQIKLDDGYLRGELFQKKKPVVVYSVKAVEVEAEKAKAGFNEWCGKRKSGS